MDAARARKLFISQKNGAKRRGIGWELTFDEWVAWWGEDIERRGSHLGCLQMQRIADSGTYALDNIRKGQPRDNGRTVAAMNANRRSAMAAKVHQAALDALPVGNRRDDPEGVRVTVWHLYERDGEA